MASLPRARFEEIGQAFLEAARTSYPSKIAEAGETIGRALESGGKMLAFGNGGSAADAQHFAGELVVRFQSDRRALPAIALVTDAAVLTACANDVGFENVFARQIEALGRAGDVAFAISTSGSSPNIVRALETARERKLTTILLTGCRGGAAEQFSDLILAAPASVTARIQEIHLASYHLICELLDARFRA
jgi:D-sedoheptulose 7-phosphate isomerase